MKRIYKFLIILIIVMSYSVMGVSAKEKKCEFGDDLEITFSENGTTITQSFYPNVAKDNILWHESIGEIKLGENSFIDNRLAEVYDKCPSQIYYCKLETTKYAEDLLGKINALKSNSYSSTKELFSSIFSIISNEKRVYLFATKSEADNHDILKKYEEGKSGAWQFTESLKKTWDSYSSKDYASSFSSILSALKDIATSIEQNNESVYKECGILNYSGNDKETYNLACPNLFVFEQKFAEALAKYKECDKNNAACKSQRMSLVNERENQMRSYCNNILENYNFDEGTEQNCLDSCFNLSKNILAYKKNAGLIGSSDGECGLSSRLIVWIANIVKWVKYIIPVIVIILSILEFMKVIGSGKEDEMKKVQGRFIRRLIVAGLIFIVPIILEFVLEKFGFTAGGCGIIDL